MRQLVLGLVTPALLLVAVGSAKADPITLNVAVYQSGDQTNFGYPYTGNNPVIQAAYNATVAQTMTGGFLAGATPDATFVVTNNSGNISFDAGDQNGTNPYTVNGFVNSDGNMPTLTSESTQYLTGYPIGANPLAGTPTYGGDVSLDNTYMLLTGTFYLTTGEVLSITHDDGFNLVLSNGQSAGDGMPEEPNGGTHDSNPATFTYTGQTGDVTFQLAYGEAQGAPSTLNITGTVGGVAVPLSVPEPASVAMMAIGLVAVGGYKLRRRKPAVA